MHEEATDRTELGNGLLFSIPLVVSSMAIISVVSIYLIKDVEMDLLLRDVVAAAEVPAYYGLLSQIGLFLWASAAAVCLFGALVVFRRGDAPGVARFLLASGLFNLVLGADDALLMHELVLPRIGIPEMAVFFGYGVALTVYLVKFASLLVASNINLLWLALFFASVSIVTDLAFPMGVPALDLVEDGAKFIAISYWLTYFLSTSLRCVEGRLAEGDVKAYPQRLADALLRRPEAKEVKAP